MYLSQSSYLRTALATTVGKHRTPLSLLVLMAIKKQTLKNRTMLLPAHVVQEAHRIAREDFRFILNTTQQLSQ